MCGRTAGSENGDIQSLKLGQVTTSAGEEYYCHRDCQTKLERTTAMILLLRMLSKTWRMMKQYRRQVNNLNSSEPLLL